MKTSGSLTRIMAAYIASSLSIACLLSTTLRGHSQGYIVPDGITAIEGGGSPSALAVQVIQNPTNRDYTCFLFDPQGTNTFAFNHCLDEGVRAFLLSSNDPISLSSILDQKYEELGYPRSFEPGVPFFVGFYTGQWWAFTNGTPVYGFYRQPVFGWGRFVNQDGQIHMLDSALEYGGAGIYAGTQIIIQSPEPPILNIARSGNDLLLWWFMSTVNFVVQQTSDLASVNWTDVAVTPTANYTEFRYEVEVPASTGVTYYRLVSK